MSMKSQRTPGPWAWQRMGRNYFLVAQHGMREIIIGSLAIEMPVETYPAMANDGRLERVNPEHPNAKLIAAAPELLDALNGLIYGNKLNIQFDSLEDQHRYNDALRFAKSVIEKATIKMEEDDPGKIVPVTHNP
jgi:hypothetical protein